MLLIERTEGVETTQIKTAYSSTAGTAYIKFDNVKVPVENLLGIEDQGFRVIMTNFNHERWMIATFSVRTSRMVVEECLKWANQRRVFGKKLNDQPVIRQKYALPFSLSLYAFSTHFGSSLPSLPPPPLYLSTNPVPPDSPKCSLTPNPSNPTSNPSPTK